MKKGFTLIELLGVVLILAVLIILIFPSVINFIKKGNDTIDDATLKLIYNASNMYMKDMESDFSSDEVNHCITFQNLIDGGYIKDSVIQDYLDTDKTIQAIYSNNKYEFSLVSENECIEDSE